MALRATAKDDASEEDSIVDSASSNNGDFSDLHVIVAARKCTICRYLDNYVKTVVKSGSRLL